MSQHQAGFAGVPVKRLKQTTLTWKGAVHKVRHVILANFDPLPLPHFVTHPEIPKKYVTHLGLPLPPIFSRPSTKNLENPPVQILSKLFAGVFVRGFCLLSGRFCPFPFS